MELVVGVNRGETEIESFETAEYAQIDGRERDTEHTFTTRLLADHSLGRGELRTALTYANVRFREAIDANPVSRYEQRLWSAAAEVEQPVVGFLRASGGFAFDGSDTPETGGKPSLGKLSSWAGRFGLSTLAFGSTRLHASVSSRSRFAALRELYSGSLGLFEPNPDLRPERLLGFEGGATIFRSGAQLQGVVFHNRLRDAVVRVSTPTGQFKRINRDELRSTGMELLGTWAPGAVTLSGDLMLQHVRVQDPAAAGTERRPEHVPELRAGMNIVFPVGLGARAALGTDYTGVQYCVNPDVNRTERLGSTTRTNASIERDWRLRSEGRLSHLRTLIAVDNATDAALFTQCGLPDPGRTLRIGFVLR
jgi:iron complex outermembrane receptor protein